MEESFIECLAEALEVDSTVLTKDTKFKELEEWDSMTRLSVIVVLDEQYGVQISEKRFSEIQLVEDLYKEVVLNSNG